jgi:hypothetical protein
MEAYLKEPFMTVRTVTILTRLAPGEALHLSLDARTTLQVTTGAVVLREPLRWLADTVVAPVVPLSEGERHTLAQGGWVEIRACNGGADVCSFHPMPGWRALWQRLSASWRGNPPRSSVRRWHPSA